LRHYLSGGLFVGLFEKSFELFLPGQSVFFVLALFFSNRATGFEFWNDFSSFPHLLAVALLGTMGAHIGGIAAGAQWHSFKKLL
jgi:hypothetical protein